MAFPDKNTPSSAATGSGICKEPAKSRSAIPCRIASAVKRSGICQQTIGCRRFGRNLRFSPAAERCAAEVCTALSVSAQPYLPALRVRIRRDAIHRRIGLLRDLRSSATKRLKIPEVSERPYAPTPHRLSERSPPSSPIHPGVQMLRLPCSVQPCLLPHNRSFRPCESRPTPAPFIAERDVYGISAPVGLAVPNIRAVDMALCSGAAPAVETLTSKWPDTPRCADVPTAAPHAPSSGSACVFPAGLSEATQPACGGI